MTQGEVTAGVEDRYEAAREVMRRLAIDEHWEAEIDPGISAELDWRRQSRHRRNGAAADLRGGL